MPSQDGSVETLSMRIITTEYSLEKPVAHLDVTSSPFRKTNVRRVPVIHLFGSTKQGERMCMHVHGVFPYVYVVLEHDPDEAYLQKLAQAIDKAINLSLGRPSSYSQHVFNISVVHGIPYYGFHHKTCVYLKIYLYNAMLTSRLADLLLSGAVMGRSFQPHEAHIPYMLQFFIDYNLYGMNYINVSAFVKRKPIEDDANTTPGEVESQVMSGETSASHSSAADPVYKVSVCRQEVDVVAADVLNKRLIDAHIGTNPGLLALWEDERKRLRAQGLEDEISLEAPASQERSNAADVGLDKDWYERFLNMVHALDISNDEDKQSFVLPSSGELSSLNISDQQSDDDAVNEQSISELLNFNANLTQAAAQMSCRELAALLANQSESDEESISYSPKVSPIKGASTSHSHPPPSYSPVTSPDAAEEGAGEDTLTDNTLEDPSRPLSAASDVRSMSVLSGSSFTSQGSRRSRSSLYRWSKKWSQRPTQDRQGIADSATAATSQSIEQLLSGSPNPSQLISDSVGSLSGDSLTAAIISGRSSFVPSQKSALLNSSLFSDDGDDEDWLEVACSDQLRTTASGFDELYQDVASESSDEDQETTLMTQPVWEGADEGSNSETIPQVDGANDEEGEESKQPDETRVSPTFQVSNQKHPLKLTFKKSLSQSEEVPPAPVANPLKMTFRRTSSKAYTNDVDHYGQHSAPDQVGEEMPADKPKITLNIKSLTEKIKDTIPKKKKHKAKEKSHKKDKHKSKKEKRNRDVGLDDEKDSASHQSKTLCHAQLPIDNVQEDSSQTTSCLSSPPSSSVFIPKLTFAKRGDQFTIKKQTKVSPLKLRLKSPMSEEPSEPLNPPEVPTASQSMARMPQSPTMLKSPTENLSPPPPVNDKETLLPLSRESNENSNSLSSKPESGRLLSKRSKPAIKLDKHGKFTVSKEPVHGDKSSTTKSPAVSKKGARRRVKSNPLLGKVTELSKMVLPAPNCMSPNKTFVPTPMPAVPVVAASTVREKTMLISRGDAVLLPISPPTAGPMHATLTPESSNAVHTDPLNQLPTTNPFDIPMSGLMVGNNTSVFPQPIMVLQPEKFPNQLQMSHDRTISKTKKLKLVNGGQPSHSGITCPTPVQQTDDKKSMIRTTSQECSNSTTPDIASAVQSPDSCFLQTINLKRVTENLSKSSNMDDRSIEKGVTGSDRLYSRTDRSSLRINSDCNTIASAPSNESIAPTSDNNPPRERSESVEENKSGLYSNFLKTKLGQQAVAASPSQHSRASSDISSNGCDKGPLRSSPRELMSHSPLSPLESSQVTESKLSLGTSSLNAQQIENNATHSEGTQQSNVGMPKFQHGLFRKKKTGKSKHADIRKRPHGCRNVPPGVPATNPPPVLPAHLVEASPSYLASSNEAKDSIRLTLKKVKSSTSDEIQSPNLSTEQTDLRAVAERFTTLPSSTCTPQSYAEITNGPVKGRQGDDCLNVSKILLEPTGHMAEGADTDIDRAVASAGIPKDLVEQNASYDSAAEDVSESDSATLSKPRSFVDRLSQLSQVLGVAPSDRLLEELPIDLPPLVRRDKLGRRLKRGKHRGSGIRKSIDSQNVPVGKKRHKKIRAAVPVHRSDRLKRLPRRFEDSDIQIPKKTSAVAQDRHVLNADTSVSPPDVTKPLNQRFHGAKIHQNSRSSTANQHELSTNEQDLRPIRLVVAGKTVSQLQRSSKRNLRSGASQAVGIDESTQQSNDNHKDAKTHTKHITKIDSGNNTYVLSPSDVPTSSSSKQSSLQKRSRRLILQSKHLQRENSLKTRTADKFSLHHKKNKSRQLVLRSSHLPNKTDGRVMLTLRRSVLTQRDLQDNADVKSDKGSVSSKSSRKKSSFQLNRVTDFHAKYDALYSFESDGYAHKISLRSAKTLRPSTGVALCKAFLPPPVSTAKAASAHTSPSQTPIITKIPLTSGGTISELKPASRIRPGSKSSERNAISRPLTARSKTLAKLAETHGRQQRMPTQSATEPNSARPRGVSSKNSAIMPSKTDSMTTAGHPLSTQAAVVPFQNQLSELNIPPRMLQMKSTSKVVTSNSQSTALKVFEPRKLAPKPPVLPNQRVIAPKPVNVLPSMPPQNNMVIIIPSAPVRLPVTANNPVSLPTSDTFLEDCLSIPVTTTITHGFNMSSELSKAKPLSNSRIQVKPHTLPENKTGYKNCSVKISPLKLDMSTLMAEGKDDQQAVTRTMKLQSARGARNIRGIAEDKELMLKRFLAMPELTLPHKRPCLSSSISDSSAGKSYCEDANNDWQISYDDALKTAAMLSDGDAGRSHSVKLANCELGESSHVTDESHAETECAASQQKFSLGKCPCLDCAIAGNVHQKGPTILAQGLQDSESISKVLHSESGSVWHRMYNSWRTEENHDVVACESSTSPKTTTKMAIDGKGSPGLLSDLPTSPNHHSSAFSAKVDGLGESVCNETKSAKNNLFEIGDGIIKEQNKLTNEHANTKRNGQGSQTEHVRYFGSARDRTVGKNAFKELQVVLKNIKPILNRMGWAHSSSINAMEFQMAIVQHIKVFTKTATSLRDAKELIEWVELVNVTLTPALAASTVEPLTTLNHCSPVCTVTPVIETLYTELQAAGFVSDVTRIETVPSRSLMAGFSQSVQKTYTKALEVTFEMAAAEPFVPALQKASGSAHQQHESFLLDKIDLNTLAACNTTLQPLLENTFCCNDFEGGLNVCEPYRTTCRNEKLLAPVTVTVTALDELGESVNQHSNKLDISTLKQTLETQPQVTVAELLQITNLGIVDECSPSVCEVAEVGTYTMEFASAQSYSNRPIIAALSTSDSIVELETGTPIKACVVAKGLPTDVTTCNDVVEYSRNKSCLSISLETSSLHQSKAISTTHSTKAEVGQESSVHIFEAAVAGSEPFYCGVSSCVQKLYSCDVIPRVNNVVSAKQVRATFALQTVHIDPVEVLNETLMAPLNLSVKQPTTWRQPVVTDNSMPIDLSVKRKRPSPCGDPINLSVKRQTIAQPPSQASSTEGRPVAVRLDQHFRIVEGPSSTFVQGNRTFAGTPRCSNSKTDHNAFGLTRRISASTNAAFEHFSTTQTDGCHDSPEPSDDEPCCSDGEGDAQAAASTPPTSNAGTRQDGSSHPSVLSPCTSPSNRTHVLPTTSTSHAMDSEETVWSNISDSSDVDIVYGTPSDDEQPARFSHLLSDPKPQTTPTDSPVPSTPPQQLYAGVDDSLYTAIKRFKADDKVPTATHGRYTLSSKPPSVHAVQSTVLELGLALVDNVYPFFSKVKDCQSALADPLSRNCNRRFDERCPKHLSEVALQSPSMRHVTQQPAKVARFELVKPPPSLQAVQQWLHQPTTAQADVADMQAEESAPSGSPDSQLLVEEDIVVPASPDTPSASQAGTDARTASRASLTSKVSERSGRTSTSSHHHLFSTQLLQSLSDTDSRPASRRSSAFADKPTNERSLLADQTLSVSQGDFMSFSPIVASQQLADVTAAWEAEKSSIEGMSGRDLAAQTDNVLQQMASHNTAYNDIVTMSLEIHVNTRGTLCPDSTQDEVEALFLHVHHDTAAADTYHYVLVRCDGRYQQVPVFASVAPVSVQQCDGERQLLQQLVHVVSRHDPDLLVGWEVNNLSWGYIIRRARTFNADLANELSRIPKAANPNQSFQDPATHNTEFARVGGRVLVNMWKVMRHQMGLGLIPSLTNYNFENVVYHILNLRVPKFTWRDLSDWYTLPKKRQLVLDYYLRRTSLLHTMEQRIDFIGQTSEFARVYGIEFCDVVIKGSQFKVESMMLRIAKPLNFVAVSPNVQQRVRMLPPECIPLTLEPESQFYADPMIVLDFQSLYPSIMIAYNYCFSTCLGHISQLERAGGEDFKFGCTSLRIPAHVLTKVKDHINVSPNGVAFVKQHVRKGVISRMVEEILDTRLMVKRCMSRYKTDKGLHKLLHARQLGLKLIANVTFGYTAANFSGRMPCVEVGDSIVRKARETLERAIKMVNESDKWQSRVVYGDTDSLFVLVPGRSLAAAFKIGEEIRDAVTADNPKPIKLKLEKVYMGCVLQTKKRYAGYMYETADQKEPVFDAKGIETVRRDSVPAVSKMLEKSLTMLFATRDISQVKSYVQKQLTKVLEGKAKLQDFIFAKEYRGLRGYKPTAKVAALLIARKRATADIWSEPLPAERVPYVIVCGAPGTPLYNLVREPQDVLANPQLKLNTVYYVTRVILPPLHRAFSLLGVNVFGWYEELPKSQRLTAGTSAANSVKSTLPQYFSSVKCLVCEGGCQATVCYKCLTTGAQDTVVALNRLVSRQLQMEHAALQICRQCSNMSSDNRVPCVSLDCPVIYKRTQLHNQRPLSVSICEKYLGKVNNF